MTKLMSRKILLSVFVLFSLSIIPVLADESGEVALTVTVIAPEYETYVGQGLLYIEDQRAHGKANLLIPKDGDYPVRLEIFRDDRVIASWEWSISEHETETREYRKHEYIIDKYVCEDGDGRRLWISIYTHRWHDRERITVMATGRRVLFIAHA